MEKKGTTEGFPFDNQTLVFKILGKMFALTNVEGFESVNLKVNPEYGVELRDRYASILEAYHMNKVHWITVVMDGTVPDKLVKTLIDNSYDLVASGLTRSQKSTLSSK